MLVAVWSYLSESHKFFFFFKIKHIVVGLQPLSTVGNKEVLLLGHQIIVIFF